MQTNEAKPARLVRFDLLTANAGWVLLGMHLFWTEDAGRSWDEIGPSISSGGSLLDVQFIDPNQGFVLWTTTNSYGSAVFHLARTADHGSTWTIRSLALFQPGDISSNPASAQMGWLDERNGWISIRQHSGSNFDFGSLFTTSDGGTSWRRFALPATDSVYFSDQATGWAVGGPSHNRIFKSQDGGTGWKNISPPDISRDPQVMIYPPFVSDGQGLVVITRLGEENRLEMYALDSPEEDWSPAGQVNLDSQPGRIGLSILDAQNLVAVIPGTTLIIRMTNGALDLLQNEDGLSSSIVELDMVSLEMGWAKSFDANCVNTSSPDTGSDFASCSSTTRLLQTTNGGMNWQIVKLPTVPSDVFSPEADQRGDYIISSTLSGQGNTQVLVGQGFDRCEIPTLSQMRTWSESSPYQAVNLYIGGDNRACDNDVLISSYVFQLYQQGWKFIPTWVGPQAPCTGYRSRMSSDVSTAYQQGVTQANQAVERLAALGLTDPAKTGAVIYYDIEYYGYDSACRSAVKSFMNGWVSQIRARGSLAGVYGSTLCGTGLSDFLNITNIPDVVWPARWYHSQGSGFYDPSASVWNLGSCVPNTVWANHQRIRQYEGDHYETWEGLTLDIDSNVLDGVVAIPYDYPFVSAIARAGANPSNAASVDFTVIFSKPVTGVDKSDFNLSTSGVSSASVSSVSGSGATYTVTVNSGTGDGSIRLNLADNDSIQDGSNQPLGSTGAGNGNYTYGQSYTIVKATFVDVSTSHIFWREIEAFYQAGITTGCSQSPRMYCPYNNVTRAEMAVFLERAMSNFAPSPSPTGMFADVPANHWASEFIDEFYNDGITTGCAVNPLQYCPDNNVTRQEMAVFIERALGKFNPTPNPTGMFADVPYPGMPSTFPAFIEQFYNDGITTGCNLNPLRYCPQNYVTRQEMAAFIVRAFHLPLP